MISVRMRGIQGWKSLLPLRAKLKANYATRVPIREGKSPAAFVTARGD